MALWCNDAFVLFADSVVIWLLAKERRCAAEVNAHRQEDGDIEHTQKKYLKMTYSCDKKLISVMQQQKVCNVAEKNKSTVERTVGKICRQEKFRTHRYIKNTQRRKTARK